MHTLHPVQMAELTRAHHAELLKEAEMYHLARQLEKPKAKWWKNLFRPSAQLPAPALNPNVTPELG